MAMAMTRKLALISVWENGSLGSEFCSDEGFITPN